MSDKRLNSKLNENASESEKLPAGSSDMREYTNANESLANESLPPSTQAVFERLQREAREQGLYPDQQLTAAEKSAAYIAEAKEKAAYIAEAKEKKKRRTTPATAS